INTNNTENSIYMRESGAHSFNRSNVFYGHASPGFFRPVITTATATPTTPQPLTPSSPQSNLLTNLPSPIPLRESFKNNSRNHNNIWALALQHQQQKQQQQNFESSTKPISTIASLDNSSYLSSSSSSVLDSSALNYNDE